MKMTRGFKTLAAASVFMIALLTSCGNDTTTETKTDSVTTETVSPADTTHVTDTTNTRSETDSTDGKGVKNPG